MVGDSYKTNTATYGNAEQSSQVIRDRGPAYKRFSMIKSENEIYNDQHSKIKRFILTHRITNTSIPINPLIGPMVLISSTLPGPPATLKKLYVFDYRFTR